MRGVLLPILSIRATRPDPVVYFRKLEFPEAANLVGRKTSVVDPAIHGILGDPEVLGDLFDRGPWLSQSNVLPQLHGLRQNEWGRVFWREESGKSRIKSIIAYYRRFARRIQATAQPSATVASGSTTQ